MNVEKFYRRSNGEMIPMSSLETTHLINSLSKKYREIFETTNETEYYFKTQEIVDLTNELYSRFEKFNKETIKGGK